MVNYLGIGGPGQIGNIRPTQSNKTNEASNTDAAQFADALKNAQATPSVSNEKSERAERVAELKAQVASGSYQPDMKQVSTSLLSFLTER
ncbi:MAG: flagellar biosynthesis anti-sigma factor FlgM [Desulfotalea sp.]